MVEAPHRIETERLVLRRPMPPDYRMTRRVATADAIRQFCDAIGDFNPLYRNREYVRNTRYGGLIAPPQFLGAVAPYSVNGDVGSKTT